MLFAVLVNLVKVMSEDVFMQLYLLCFVMLLALALQASSLAQAFSCNHMCHEVCCVLAALQGKNANV